MVNAAFSIERSRWPYGGGTGDCWKGGTGFPRAGVGLPSGGTGLPGGNGGLPGGNGQPHHSQVCDGSSCQRIISGVPGRYPLNCAAGTPTRASGTQTSLSSELETLSQSP